MQNTASFYHKYSDYKKFDLAQDCSNRVYQRFIKNDKSFIFMDSHKELNSLKNFIKIDELLINLKLSAPVIYERDEENGFLLLQDFGDNTFFKLINNNYKNIDFLFNKAIKTSLHIIDNFDLSDSFLDQYNEDVVTKEVEWFYHYLEYSNIFLIDELKSSFISIWQKIFKNIKDVKCSIHLRDFHVNNLMLINDNNSVKSVGLLDFQDAILAPIASDLFSLIEDARIDVDQYIYNKFLKQFLNNFAKGDHDEIFESGVIMSMIRHFRIMGLFSYRIKYLNDQRFLSRIKHLEKLISKHINLNIFKELKEFLKPFLDFI